MQCRFFNMKFYPIYKVTQFFICYILLYYNIIGRYSYFYRTLFIYCFFFNFSFWFSELMQMSKTLNLMLKQLTVKFSNIFSQLHQIDGSWSKYLEFWSCSLLYLLFSWHNTCCMDRTPACLLSIMLFMYCIISIFC